MNGYVQRAVVRTLLSFIPVQISSVVCELTDPQMTKKVHLSRESLSVVIDEASELFGRRWVR